MPVNTFIQANFRAGIYFCLEICAEKGENKCTRAKNIVFCIYKSYKLKWECLLMKLEDSKTNEIHDVVADIEKDLRYISGIIKQKGREILSDFTITPPQFVALQWLFEEGDMTIGELSNKMYLACSTTTDLVDRMEKNNLVKRVKDPNDRRVVRIQLLEVGERIIEEVIKKRQEYLKEVLKDFTNKEVLFLKDNLMKLHQDMRIE
jgi:DNA-binding MarR family transcriptional regulator